MSSMIGLPFQCSGSKWSPPLVVPEETGPSVEPPSSHSRTGMPEGEGALQIRTGTGRGNPGANYGLTTLPPPLPAALLGGRERTPDNESAGPGEGYHKKKGRRVNADPSAEITWGRLP